MSYRYPHQDDSDENGFGESIQQSSGYQPAPVADDSDDDEDVFEPAAEASEAQNLETGEDDEDEEDPDYEQDEEEDEDEEFHGSCFCAARVSCPKTDPISRCRARLPRRSDC